MRLLKSQSILRLVNSYVVDSPQPANLNYMWNFGSLLATCLILQILTGVFLAMKQCVAVKSHYVLGTPKTLSTNKLKFKFKS